MRRKLGHSSNIETRRVNSEAFNCHSKLSCKSASLLTVQVTLEISNAARLACNFNHPYSEGTRKPSENPEKTHGGHCDLRDWTTFFTKFHKNFWEKNNFLLLEGHPLVSGFTCEEFNRIKAVVNCFYCFSAESTSKLLVGFLCTLFLFPPPLFFFFPVINLFCELLNKWRIPSC